MKILQLIDEPWDSGLTHYALQLSVVLQRNGEEVCVGVRSGKKPEAVARGLGLTTAPIQNVFAARRLIRSRSWDIINAHTGHTHTLAVLFAKGARIVRTRGDARPLKSSALSRTVYRKTAAVIAASDHIRRQYELEFGFKEDRVRTIYPSVLADPAVAPLPPRRVGILGRLDPVKGHTVFLEAAAQVLKEIPDAQFLVAGKEAGVSIKILANQAGALGVQPAVTFLGFQPSSMEFMRGCSFGVVASIGSEAISRACLEWMAVGRPVVGTLVGSLPELIEPRETGLVVPPGDSAAMASAFLKLLREPEIAQKWGRNAHALVLRRFSPDIQLQKTLELYKGVRS